MFAEKGLPLPGVTFVLYTVVQLVGERFTCVISQSAVMMRDMYAMWIIDVTTAVRSNVISTAAHVVGILRRASCGCCDECAHWAFCIPFETR